MKKKKGNLTLNQLETRKRLVTLIGFILSVILIITCILVFLALEMDFNTIPCKIILLIMITVCVLPISCTIFLNEEYDEQIELKERQIKVKTIKKIAKEGNLKEFVTLKKREIIEYILLVEIDKIEIKPIQYQGNAIILKNSGFTIDIYLKNGESLNFSSLSDNKVLELLNPNFERIILSHLITNINLSKEPEGDMELTITGKDDFDIYREDIFDEDDLLDIFELKEE